MTAFKKHSTQITAVLSAAATTYNYILHLPSHLLMKNNRKVSLFPKAMEETRKARQETKTALNTLHASTAELDKEPGENRG